ncbi:RNA polymerase sigma factor [Alkalihalobacillus pseudalcaliphilus]|uniref:RNA polymerase sigma factor n=1 Tax=Alkalihalobacillus pseudalcaliphilus TaxID=79884 RepID=UPI00064DA666|nr:RNA polymerase sigma factor [Alkalihalobacillus pseudalcaliphilus]KMK76472.1 RNA polymerase sigma factor [Alkalihalobacillus pseudalcaliphilus]
MKEEEWLRQAKEGNEEAFHSLVSTHLKTVERFCFQLGVPAYQIDDVTQEVFIKVYRFITKHTHGKFTTWLYSLTLNVVRDFYRHEQRQKKKWLQLKEKKQLLSDEAYIEKHFDEESRHLHVLVQSLDSKYKVPIVLHYFHDLSYLEIADVMEISEGAVKTRMLRAKKQLKEKYTKEGEPI